MKRACMILLCILSLTGCYTTKYIPIKQEIEIPSLEVVYPEAPELLEVPYDAIIPEAVLVNQVRLFGYIEKLEGYADSLNRYIEKVNEIMKGADDAEGNPTTE